MKEGVLLSDGKLVAEGQRKMATAFEAVATPSLDELSAVLGELAASQAKVSAMLQEEKNNFDEVSRQCVQQTMSTFVKLPLYENKVRGIRKNMLSLHKRMFFLKQSTMELQVESNKEMMKEKEQAKSKVATSPMAAKQGVSPTSPSASSPTPTFAPTPTSAPTPSSAPTPTIVSSADAIPPIPEKPANKKGGKGKGKN